MMDTALHTLLRFAPAARMFFSGTLCGRSLHEDGVGTRCLHLLERGELAITRSDAPAERLVGPGVVLFTQPVAHRLEGLHPDGVELMCATLSEFGHPLSLVLPELVLIPLDEANMLRQPIDLLFQEARNASYGHLAAIDRLLQYTLVLIVRHLIERGQLQGGLLAAIADPRIGPALQALHEAPQQRWTVESLAKVAGLSRTVFAQRFAQLVGTTPLAYLSAWRMGLARMLLTEGKSVKSVAATIGYRSESAFARAFTRDAGHAPMRWLAAQESSKTGDEPCSEPRREQDTRFASTAPRS